MKQRYKLPIAVYLIILNSKKEVLLGKRKNTGYMDGFYTLVSGHKEQDENILEALIRETKEEANIDIKEKDVKFVSVINRKTGEIEYIDFFYILENYDGKYKNTEPEKCEHLKFFNLNNLPENTVGHVKYILANLDKKNYSVIYGW